MLINAANQCWAFMSRGWRKWKLHQLCFWRPKCRLQELQPGHCSQCGEKLYRRTLSPMTMPEFYSWFASCNNPVRIFYGVQLWVFTLKAFLSVWDIVFSQRFLCEGQSREVKLFKGLRRSNLNPEFRIRNIDTNMYLTDFLHFKKFFI